MRALCVRKVDEYSLKEGFEMKHHHVCLAFCIGCICDLPQAITVFVWTTIVNFLSQGADHPMSSPCWVDRAGPVLAYRTMHSNDFSHASSPMTSLLDIL